MPGPVAFDFVNTAKLFACPGMTGATGNIYVGLHEFEHMAFALHFLRPDDLFVDVGANIGSYVVLASAGVGARCIAFEPGSAAFHWLRLNIQLNGVAQLVDARRQALGAQAGTALLTTGLDTVNHIVMRGDRDSSSVEVEIATMDHALVGQTPAMLKIDVEGYETAVVGGAKRILSTPTLRCVLIELVGHGSRYGFDECAVRNTIEQNGFDAYQYLPRERRLVRPSTEARSAKSGNMLFIRNAEFVGSRLRTARSFTVRGEAI